MGILVGALRMWADARPEQTFVATVMFVLALAVTGPSFWYTHVRGTTPGENFAYVQVIFDALLVTAIVHITGGGESSFAPLYILVISIGALLLPLPGGVLVGALASILYFADIVWVHSETLSGSVTLQIGLFAVVALITGWVGDRVRRAGLALGAVESELRQLRLDTGDILANIATGVLTVDGSGRLVYLNPAGEALLGLRAQQWMGAPVLSAVDEVAPGMGSMLRRSIEQRTPVNRFKTATRRNESDVTLGVSTAVLERGADEPPSVTAIFQDITDQERLELLDRRNERLQAVAELAASLAHEIKNPLASIRSAVEQIAKPSLEQADRTTLQRLVVGESERLSRLLSEFIEFSALRMGERAEVDLSRLIRDCISLVRQHPDAGDEVRITEEGLEGTLYIPGDADLLHRAVFNLVLNAVQFAGADGEVVVSLSDDSDDPYPRGTSIPSPVRLTVRDTGPGIDPEEVPRIFDPFYTTRGGGSGLGLAVVHRTVEAHRGAIFVEEAPGGGAQFVIFVPGGAPRGSPVPAGRGGDR